MAAVDRAFVERLVRRVVSVKPLLEGVAEPVRVVSASSNGAPASGHRPAPHGIELAPLVDRVARQVGVTALQVIPDCDVGDLGLFERVVSSRLSLAEFVSPTPSMSADVLERVDQIVADTMASGFEAEFTRAVATSRDGVPLAVYHGGPDSDPVVVVPASGMPVALAESWLRFLARDRKVLTWESRGLFGVPTDRPFDFAADTHLQAEDLLAVMDHHGVETAHVVGLCGGAVVGLAAAASCPARISSLSLWHGAYDFGPGSPRTTFQNDLIELMALGARNRSVASSVHATFCQMTLTNMPAHLAHLLLYPYASAELFHRYCRQNGTLAEMDVRAYVGSVRQPTLVVTSNSDETAHPAGSIRLADELMNGRLHLEEQGDHISLFSADPRLMRVATDFIVGR